MIQNIKTNEFPTLNKQFTNSTITLCTQHVWLFFYPYTNNNQLYCGIVLCLYNCLKGLKVINHTR